MQCGVRASPWTRTRKHPWENLGNSRKACSLVVVTVPVLVSRALLRVNVRGAGEGV